MRRSYNRSKESTLSTVIIEAYKFGYIRVDGVEYDRDVVIFPDRVSPEWWRDEGHNLSLNDLTEVLEYGPEVLVVGTGAHGVMKVPQTVAKELQTRGIELRAAKTSEAVETFNELLAAGRRVVAALHLTC
ncbi:MAG: Mth938-like domain-containing protein [Candidatus Coatesbacteria bacterium]|nr:MAG: Mth938-like domain-containing protein [Candidatus Coatesbacteria bacterium]